MRTTFLRVLIKSLLFNGLHFFPLTLYHTNFSILVYL